MDRNRPVFVGKVERSPSWRGTTGLTAYFNVCLIKSIQQLSVRSAPVSHQIYLRGGWKLSLGNVRKQCDERSVITAQLQAWGVFLIQHTEPVHPGAADSAAWLNRSRNCIHCNQFTSIMRHIYEKNKMVHINLRQKILFFGKWSEENHISVT